MIPVTTYFLASIIISANLDYHPSAYFFDLVPAEKFFEGSACSMKSFFL